MNSGLFRRLDFSFLAIVLLLIATGVLNLYSASRMEVGETTPVYIKQLYWVGVGLFFMIVTILFDYHFFKRWAYVLYTINLLLLLGLLFIGGNQEETVRWYSIGGVSFQPSELMKLSLILVVARYLSRNMPDDGMRIRDLFIPATMVIVPAILILKEPDLGSAGFLMLLFVTLIFTVRMRRKTLLVLCLSAALMAPLVPLGVYFAWDRIPEYQQDRVRYFLHPELDPDGKGFQIIQSKIAIGSGMLFGRGYMKGTQGQLKFLPEQHTDFIFSVFAEEWGFIGSVLLFAIILALILRSLYIAAEARDIFGAIVALGISTVFLWQSFINIAMTMQFFPVVGIPLPFFSYGGSSMVTTFISVGLLLNIHMRRHMF